MPNWITTSSSSIVMIVISSTLIFFTLIVFTRLVGLRSFSKMSSFDFAMTIAVGSILASVLLNKSTPLADGVVALATIFALQFTVTMLRKHTNWAASLIDNQPRLLMQGDKILYKNLEKTRVTEDDLFAKLREANVLNLDQVRAVVLETTGDISVLHTSDSDTSLQDKLLQSVLP
ncbi:DUF421 domain-containing protein [Hellea sp.]|nr:DUF421 domain-containing protein [Hellea sp.]